MSHTTGRLDSEAMDEVREVYRSLERRVRSREEVVSESPPDGVETGLESVAESLSLPVELWTSGAKPTRTVPALVAYERHLDGETFDSVLDVLVGLDVLVTMLDEFIDTADAGARHRTDLAINTAFASLLSFTSVPAGDQERVVGTITDFLVRTARIPATERAVQKRLASVDDPDRAMELMRFSYATRSRDISAFGRIPAIVHDVDARAASRIVDDLETYRAHYLLFDDIRDVREDRRNGTETPATWVLATSETPEEALGRLGEIFAAFEYSQTPYRATLRDLEQEPAELLETVRDAMDALEDEPSPSAGVPRS